MTRCTPQFNEETRRLIKLRDALRQKVREQKAQTKPTPAEVLEKIDGGKNVTHRNVYDLAQAHVRKGVHDESAVMAAVTADLKSKGAAVTERDVRRLFTEYGKDKFPTKDADVAELRQLKTLVRLQEDIDRLSEGLPRLKGARQARVSAEVQAKRDQIKALEKARRATKTVEELYQEQRAKSFAKQLAEVKARIEANDYARRPRVDHDLDAANTKAQFELAKAKADFGRRQFEYELSKRSPLAKIFGKYGTAHETLNLSRAIMTSFDLSAVLRQGGFIVLGHPVRAAKAIVPMLKAFASEKAAFEVQRDIESRPNYSLYRKAGLELTETTTDAKPTKVEEQFMSRWLDRSEPVQGETGKNIARTAKNVVLAPVRGSGRAFTTFLNKLRADSFDAMTASLARESIPTMEEAKAVANYINVATGRGKIGTTNQGAVGLNVVFFAPRLVASRFNLLFGQPMYGGTARTKALVAAEYARFLTGVATVYSLGYLASLADDKKEQFLTLDPRSSDFGKMRFGNTRVDPLAGLAQVTTFLARVGSGETITGKGELKPLREQYRFTDIGADDLPHKVAYGASDITKELWRFTRTKFAPIPGTIVSLLASKDPVGNYFGPKEAAVSLTTPLSFRNVYDVMVENGVPGGTAITMLELLGMGVGSYDSKKPKEK